ncbi:MAG: amidohydrolase family protein [Rhizobiaceae bacterium]|nr:amidohydrolase family protein [Rhizobiaceae bacterium]
MNRIDAHQHFWRIDARRGAWPPAELDAIHRDFEPGDLAPLLRAAGVGGTVVVQSLDRDEDTDYLLDLADRVPFVLGVVGWVDMKSPAAPERIAALAARGMFKGVRPMLQDIADTNWIDDLAIAPAVDALCRHGLCFDALVTPRNLPPLHRFAERRDRLRIVVDHGAKPFIGEGRFADWRGAMAGLARLPNVFCKLSGLLTEAGDQRPEAVRPYAETILDLFGAERTMWGSDWPVLNLASNYEAWLSQCLDIVSSRDHDAVFANTATAFYRLKSPE